MSAAHNLATRTWHPNARNRRDHKSDAFQTAWLPRAEPPDPLDCRDHGWEGIMHKWVGLLFIVPLQGSAVRVSETTNQKNDRNGFVAPTNRIRHRSRVQVAPSRRASLPISFLT